MTIATMGRRMKNEEITRGLLSARPAGARRRGAGPAASAGAACATTSAPSLTFCRPSTTTRSPALDAVLDDAQRTRDRTDLDPAELDLAVRRRPPPASSCPGPAPAPCRARPATPGRCRAAACARGRTARGAAARRGWGTAPAAESCRCVAIDLAVGRHDHAPVRIDAAVGQQQLAPSCRRRPSDFARRPLERRAAQARSRASRPFRARPSEGSRPRSAGS